MALSASSTQTPAAPRASAPRFAARCSHIDAVAWLSSLVAALSAFAATVGIFVRGGSGPFPFMTLHGEVVQIYGRGLYRNDSLFTGSLNRGTDAALLLTAVPLLTVAIGWYRRGSLRGRLLLTGTLAYFLYLYASLALGAAAYNDLFLLYVVLFSASLFAFILAFRSIDLGDLVARVSPRMPRRALGVFLLVSGGLTTVVWLGMGLLPAMLAGAAGRQLHGYTTYVTYALDLGVITPACFLAGVLLQHRAALGYVIACALLGILALLGPAFVAQLISQMAAGVTFTPGEIVGPIAGFGIIALIAIGLLVALLRYISDTSRSAPSART